jgi:hypothetical protein
LHREPFTDGATLKLEAMWKRLRVALVVATGGAAVVFPSLSTNEARHQRITAPRPLPSDSYSYPPDMPFDRSDYVIKINQMSSFYDKRGEFAYAIHGERTVSFRAGGETTPKWGQTRW